MKKIILFLLIAVRAYADQTISATYYEPGVNSPWMAGIDYDYGFAKVLSVNAQIAGGVSSQVNRQSTFGDVFLGEAQLGFRVYMNKADRWDGVFATVVGRAGIYNIPIRTQDDPSTSASVLIINRGTMLQLGAGVYVGYRWQRNLVNNMSGMPFMMVIEPYLGWTLDSFINVSVPSDFTQTGLFINRFTVGLTFKVGFYTHKKSAETLQREADEAAKEELDDDAYEGAYEEYTVGNDFNFIDI